MINEAAWTFILQIRLQWNTQRETVVHTRIIWQKCNIWRDSKTSLGHCQIKKTNINLHAEHINDCGCQNTTEQGFQIIPNI